MTTEKSAALDPDGKEGQDDNYDDPSDYASEPSTSGRVKSSRFNLDQMHEAAKQYSAEGGFESKASLIEVPVE